MNLLKYLKINRDFLNEDPEDWKDNSSFEEGMKKVSNLPVINDVAERGVKLIENFNGRHTKKDEQLQFLLGIVSEDHKMFPSSTKSLLLPGPH